MEIHSCKVVSELNKDPSSSLIYIVYYKIIFVWSLEQPQWTIGRIKKKHMEQMKADEHHLHLDIISERRIEKDEMLSLSWALVK